MDAFSTEHAIRKSLTDAPREMLNKRLNRAISAPLLTVALLWREEEL